MTIQIYVENGVEYRHEPTPPGWLDVITYRPYITPWDYYGRKHLKEYGYVFKRAGIRYERLITTERKLRPSGTGPGGAIRFGDAVLPGVYRIAVPASYVELAEWMIQRHRQEVDDWLFGNGSKPAAVTHR